MFYISVVLLKEMYAVLSYISSRDIGKWLIIRNSDTIEFISLTLPSPKSPQTTDIVSSYQVIA